jgi:anthranilate 1,2-dioxygenase small subunit
VYATGRYIDLYRLKDGAPRLRERIVVCDSSRFDTLLALPL